MTELRVTGHLHDFASKGSSEHTVAVVDCTGCERQCGFTGLYIKDATLEVEDGTQTVTSGRASTSLYETETFEEFTNLELDDMVNHTLDLGQIRQGVPVSELTEFTMRAVSDLRQAGGCLIELAQSERETAIL